MRVYLDNCCFNRPFDDQGHARIRLETEAKLEVQDRVQSGQIELAWSYILDFENQANPFEQRRQAIAVWRHRAVIDIAESEGLRDLARQIMTRGVHPKDALHIACAIESKCNCFLTTDDLLIRKMKGFDRLPVLNPADFILENE